MQPQRTFQSRRAADVLETAGEEIKRHRYVVARTDYRVHDEAGDLVKSATIMFGPRSRAHVEVGETLACYDGSTMSRRNLQSGEIWKHPISHLEVNPILLVGTALEEGQSLPLPAARLWGRRWWRELYGTDAIVEMREPEALDGNECHVIAVQPQHESFSILWWIDKRSRSFARFLVVPADHDIRPQGVVDVRYKVIQFPKKLDERSFSAAPGG